MYRWSEWAGDEEPKQWAQNIIIEDRGLAQFLEQFLQTTRTIGGSDVTTRLSYYLDPKSLEPFLEPSKITDRARVLVEDSGMTERQRLAAREFIQGYEMRERGEDPTFPLP